MFDFSHIKFRANTWGNLLTEPKTKEAKERGELSETCKAELIKVYCEEVYGRKKDIITPAMDKGKQVEGESIVMFSMVEGEFYFKNEERLTNDYFSGHPDIFTGESIHKAKLVGDIKSSWELQSFLPKLIESPDKNYIAQLNVYFDLTGAEGGFLAYCLTDCPPNILESEKRKLLYSMNVATELNPDYIRAAQELEHLLTFKDIPPEERVIKIPIHRDEELIQKMKDKVPRLREWLESFHRKHKNQYK